jgi:hypothetical protein
LRCASHAIECASHAIEQDAAGRVDDENFVYQPHLKLIKENARSRTGHFYLAHDRAFYWRTPVSAGDVKRPEQFRLSLQGGDKWHVLHW